MGNQHNIKNFTSADIAAYHQGRLSPAEMHALEKAAMEDPFLGDALEGYNQQPTLNSDLADLHSRLQERITGEKKAPVISILSYRWLRIAAMVIVVAGAGLLIYQFGGNNAAIAPVAQKDNISSSMAKADTLNAVLPPVNKELEREKDRTVVTSVESHNSNSASNTVSPELRKAKALAQAQANDSIRAAKNEEEKLVINDDLLRDKNFKSQSREIAKETQSKNYSKDLAGRTPGVAVESQRPNAVPTDNNYQQAYSRARRNAGFNNQTNVFRGRVTDDENKPLPFVNITNPLDNVGTYSDARGYFAITYPDSVLDVQVRSLGYLNQNARLQTNLTDNKIVMNDDRSTLNEIVVSNKQVNTKRRQSNLVLEEPEPADGWSNYDAYLANNLNIPETFVAKQMSGGEVELSFEINKLGEPVNIRVEKSLCETCDKEAIRLVREGPKWKRKAKKGRTSVTIAF